MYKLFIILCSLARYILADIGHACCISGRKQHQRCECNQAPLSKCKYYCDNDVQCKGYVSRRLSVDGCDLATSSPCPPKCTQANTGSLGELDSTSRCGIAYGSKTGLSLRSGFGGCYIKKPGIIMCGTINE